MTTVVCVVLKDTVAGDAERCFVSVAVGVILMEFVALRWHPGASLKVWVIF